MTRTVKGTFFLPCRDMLTTLSPCVQEAGIHPDIFTGCLFTVYHVSAVILP
jgi:hypothetical protein